MNLLDYDIHYTCQERGDCGDGIPYYLDDSHNPGQWTRPVDNDIKTYTTENRNQEYIQKSY